MMTDKTVIAYLASHGIKASVQRIGVMRYLMEHRTHPCVEDIHAALLKEIPTLSKTTVYNTLKLLVENGAASMITIDERTTKYDADRTPHDHFLCTSCNRIIDIPACNDHAPRCLPEGCILRETQTYYRGLCPECSKKQQDSNATPH